MLFNNITKSGLSVKKFMNLNTHLKPLAMQGIGEMASFQFVFTLCFVA